MPEYKRKKMNKEDVINYINKKHKEGNGYCKCVKLVMDKYHLTEPEAVPYVSDFIGIQEKQKKIKEAILV